MALLLLPATGWAILLGALAAGALGVLAFVLHQRQIQELKATAERLGLSYADRAHRRLDQLYGLRFLARGRNRRFYHFMTGTFQGYAVETFDFRCEIQSGENSHHERRGVVLVRVPGALFPDLTIEPETVLHRIGDAVGFNDIDFESTEFSRKTWVQARDRKFAYDVLHPRAMEHVMKPGWDRWEIRGPFVAMWRNGARKPTEIEDGLKRVIGLVDRIPRFVRDRHTVASKGPVAARPAWIQV